MKPKSNYITPEQFQQILNHVPELHIRKWFDKDVQMAFKIAYWIGLRMGEVPKLTKEDFDFLGKEVFLGKTKTKSNYGSIPPRFIPELQQYWNDKRPLEPVLKDCKPQNIYKWLIRIGQELEIQALITPQSITGEKTKMHVFRKSIGKDIMNGTYGKKGTLIDSQSHLRHFNPVTTGRYLRLDIEGSKEYWDQ